jgi:lysophospholipase L1-like esterase
MQNGELPTNLNPSVFVVLIGTNDLSYDQCSAENVVIGILRCVEYILAERPNATVLLHGLLPRTLDKKGYLVPSGFSKSEHDNRSSSSLKVPYVWSHIKIVNAELERYANHRRSVEYFDPSDIFLKSRKQIDFDLMPDGTHPSKNGYELWGKQLQTKIVRMINESL